jgi:DNA modification methylase
MAFHAAAASPAALPLNRVHRGDCLDLLARMPDAGVHLAFADPPFNIGYDYDTYDDRLAADAYLEWSKRWMGEVARVLRPDGTFWLAIGDEYAAELKVIATRELGFTCRSWVVWYYTFGVNCRQKFSRSHAHLFHFVKDPAAFTFNTDAIRVPSARELVYGDKRACPTGRLPDDTWILRPQDLADGFAADGDTWYFPRVCGTFKERSGWHGCQMPEQLLGRIIRASSRDDDVVLDPFGGSGTTLAVAKKLGRRFVGLELSEQYAARIEERLAAIAPGDPLDGAPEPLKSVPATKDGRRLAAKDRGRPPRSARKKASRKTAAAVQRSLLPKGRAAR